MYIGGTPYTAPVVIEYTGIVAYQKYYLHRDYLGSITHITNQSGNLEAEYSYTACSVKLGFYNSDIIKPIVELIPALREGRLRNPANWEVYAVGQELELMFGRGYTGHSLSRFSSGSILRSLV